MRRRAEQVAQTRARIVDAASDLFAQRGVEGTTMTEVARIADVSPATVTNHFATPELLLEAVVERLMTDIRLPDSSIFTGSSSTEDRIRALTAAMFEFFDRTQHWFDLLGAELNEVPALARAKTNYWRAVQALYAQALADTQDEVLAKTTAGLVHPTTFNSLRGAGLSIQEASDVVADSITFQAARASDRRPQSRT
jgi:AcrR family transcriptional regulator